MLDSVVTFKWKPPFAYRSTFTSNHVNLLYRAMRRFYPKKHRFICITDDPNGLEAAIEYVPLWNTYSNLKNPTWAHGPNCYPRLFTFGKAFREIAGERFLCLDLDVAIMDDVTPLIDRTDDFVIWGTGRKEIPYCASMYLMTAGSKSEVIERFDPIESPKLSSAAGFRGSDQAWINYCLGGNIPMWTMRDGVYSYRDHLLKKNVYGSGKLPRNARVIIFHGKPDPWDSIVRTRSPWIRRYLEYREPELVPCE